MIVIDAKWLISVRSGLCTSAQLGGFITALPNDLRLNDTSIYTTPLKFTEGSFPTPTTPDAPEPISTPEEEPVTPQEGEEEGGSLEEEGRILDNTERSHTADIERRQWDIIESITNGVKGASSSSGDVESSGERQDEGGGGGAVYEVPTYSGAVHYKVPKTGYYCVGTSFFIPYIHSIPLRTISFLLHSIVLSKVGVRADQ
jgi:hypothetical protein